LSQRHSTDASPEVASCYKGDASFCLPYVLSRLGTSDRSKASQQPATQATSQPASQLSIHPSIQPLPMSQDKTEEILQKVQPMSPLRINTDLAVTDLQQRTTR